MRGYFSKKDIVIYLISVVLVTLSGVLSGYGGALMTITSLIGVTSLILNSKGNPIGQLLMILFSILYGIVSYSFSYYGEMLTYLGMTAPMALIALISWVRHPFEKGRSEVRVTILRGRTLALSAMAAVVITIPSYFVLRYFETPMLVVSTVSVATSFIAVMLTALRTPWFAIAYAANDIVLVALWSYASIANKGYLSVVVCFLVFLVNDLYCFFSWRIMQKRQDTQLQILN